MSTSRSGSVSHREPRAPEPASRRPTQHPTRSNRAATAAHC